LVHEFPDSVPQVIVSPQRTRGCNDLWQIQPRRGTAPVYVRYRLGGKTYVEAERVPVGQVPPEARWHLAGELGAPAGAPLVPRD
jgi:hypothetical protein